MTSNLGQTRVIRSNKLKDYFVIWQFNTTLQERKGIVRQWFCTRNNRPERAVRFAGSWHGEETHCLWVDGLGSMLVYKTTRDWMGCGRGLSSKEVRGYITVISPLRKQWDGICSFGTLPLKPRIYRLYPNGTKIHPHGQSWGRWVESRWHSLRWGKQRLLELAGWQTPFCRTMSKGSRIWVHGPWLILPPKGEGYCWGTDYSYL